jgi:tetratricopeptide (TPR) repeat protein
LQAIADMPKEVLQRSLAHLQAAELLYETRLFPEYAYTFKHALTHEVAYGGLLQERRRALHARTGEALEALAGDRINEQVERLAHHAVWGEVWDKALAYCRQAGDKTMVRSAYREAAGYFEQALSALAHLSGQRDTREQAIDLRLALRSALVGAGNSGRVLAYLREAETLAEALDDSRRLGQVCRFLSRSFHRMGAYDEAVATAQRALALAMASGDVVTQALTNQSLGLVYRSQGDYRRAIDCFEQTMAFLDEARHRGRFGQLIFPAVLTPALLTVCHAELGTFAEGRALGEEGFQIAEVVDHPPSLLFALWGLCLLALCQGDLPKALPLLERAIGICHDADIPSIFPMMARAVGAAYTLGGRITDAISLLTQALERTMATEMVGSQAFCSLSLGEAQLLAGHLEEAYALTERALALTRAHQERGNEAYALRLLGGIAARCEPPESVQAEAHYRQALALATELGMRPLQAHCHRSLGTLYNQMGRAQQARTALVTAIELYRDMDMTFWLPQAEAALAQVA